MAEEKISNSRRLRVFERAVWRKSSRYTLSGLVVIGIGVILVGIGLLLTGFASSKFLIIGMGAIIALIGVVRLLIGFINPSIPQDLPPLEEPHEENGKVVEQPTDDLV